MVHFSKNWSTVKFLNGQQVIATFCGPMADVKTSNLIVIFEFHVVGIKVDVQYTVLEQ